MSEALVAQHDPGAWSSGRAWLERKRRGVMLVMLVLMFVIAALAPRIFITIPSGHGGILWLRFFGGTQTSQGALGEGLQAGICEIVTLPNATPIARHKADNRLVMARLRYKAQ